jgi:uncharacterized protein
VKFVITALAVVFLLWLLFGRARKSRREPPSAAPPPRAPEAEGMLACAHCGVHLPASESLRLGTQAYCCAAHRDAGPRDGTA